MAEASAGKTVFSSARSVPPASSARVAAVTAIVSQRALIAMLSTRAKDVRNRPGASTASDAGGFSRAPATTGVKTTATSQDAIKAMATT